MALALRRLGIGLGMGMVCVQAVALSFEGESHIFSELEQQIHPIVFEEALAGGYYVKNQGSNLAVILVPDIRSFEVLDKILLALDPPIGQLTYLLTIEALPFLSIKFFKEFQDENCIDEIDEGVPHIALVL
jgi:hypothetical protein